MLKNIKTIINKLQDGLYERDIQIKLTLLGALCGENVFLYGPAGVAKSLIARRIANIFEDGKYFEYLMQKFSTPEDIFGPISLSELKKDNYVRKIEGYLPTADIAFIDEIFKASPAILNTLLHIINEKIYKNGNKIIKVPLKTLISASNEIPEHNELEALYDRFLIRIIVNPIQDNKNFEAILVNGSANEKVEIENKISTKELEIFQNEIKKINISREIFNVIHLIREKIKNHNKQTQKNIYISDRRWQKAAFLLKASAYFNEREEINLIDTFLLTYCLWNREDEFKTIQEIVKKSIEEVLINKNKFQQLLTQKEELEKKLDYLLFIKEAVFEEVIEKNGKYYFKIEPDFSYSSQYKDIDEKEFSTVYVPLEIINTDNIFFEVLNSKFQRTILVKAKWDNQNKKLIIILNRTHQSSFSWELYEMFNVFSVYEYTPKTIKSKINKEDFKTFEEKINNLKAQLLLQIQNFQIKKEHQENTVNIFLDDDKFVLNLINEFLEKMEIEMQNLEILYNKFERVKND